MTKRTVHEATGNDDVVDKTNKKPRGRPRAEKQNGTAADRRRTQIRLAQRTYRQRKEITIESHKQKVGELQEFIHKMAVTISQINDRASESDLSIWDPDLAEELKHQVQVFAQWDKSATSETEHFKHGLDETSISPPVEVAPQKNNESNNWLEQYKPKVVEGDIWGYSLTSDETVLDDPQSNALTFMEPMKLTKSFSFNPPPALTYSFQETTFARRLHRAALEDAYRLLMTPGVAYERLTEKFSFVLPYVRLRDLPSRIMRRLRQTSQESLNSQYPHPPPTLYGPQMLTDENGNAWEGNRNLTAGDCSQAPQAEADAGYLVPEQVEQYIEDLGIRINSFLSYAEGRMITSDLDGGVQGSLQVPPKTPEVFVESPLLSQYYDGANMKAVMEVTEDSCPSNTSSAQFSITPGSRGPTRQTPLYFPIATLRATPSTKRVLVDVTKLINELVNFSVCRGHTPGIRRHDVDRALRLSTIVA